MALKKKTTFDRFITKRKRPDVADFNLHYTRIDSLSNIIFQDEEEGYLEPEFINTAKRANNIISYRQKLLNALDITYNNVSKYPKCSSWPVISRRKPLLSSPETVLDMPDIDTVDTSLYRQVIDWGNQGEIATIFHGEVHLWSCENGQVAHTQTAKSISDCVKWDRTGTKFAVTQNSSQSLSIFDGNTLKILRIVLCKCLTCRITTIEWTAEGHVITGCSNGFLTVVHNLNKQDDHFCVALDEIVDLKFSCNHNFLLITCIDRKSSIFKWPLMWNVHQATVFTITTPSISMSTSWHPWKEPLLAIGEIHNIVSIWNVNNKTYEFSKMKPYFKETSTCILDFVTFNPLSAELLVSFYHESPDSNSRNGCNFLTVFSDLHTRVDEVRYHVGRVPHILWDGTGTKMATVGTDENLAIWNFYGMEQEKGKIKGKERTKTKHCSSFDESPQFGTFIR